MSKRRQRPMRPRQHDLTRAEMRKAKRRHKSYGIHTQTIRTGDTIKP